MTFLDIPAGESVLLEACKQIAEHFLLSRQLSARPMVMHLAKSDSVYELLVMTADRPFLFSKITGVLSYFGMNIVRGQAFSNRHGTIFDLIAFEDPDRYFEKNPSEEDHLAGAVFRHLRHDRVVGVEHPVAFAAHALYDHPLDAGQFL